MEKYIEVGDALCVETPWGPFPVGNADLARETRGAINKRAHVLAKEAYERYRAELREAMEKRRINAEQIESWRPRGDVK